MYGTIHKKTERFTPVPVPVVRTYPVVHFFAKNVRVQVKKRVYVCNSRPCLKVVEKMLD